MISIIRSSRLLAVTAILTLLFSATLASANHSWGNYHWARTANPFTLKLGDNVNATWDAYLSTTSADWTQSAVLDTAIVAGRGKASCRPTNGRVEVCNKAYGNTGWLGVAQIWVNGSHITQGTVKVNDTYFNTPQYNTPAWRNLVMCQEVGHTLGLDHQDETFDNPNLGTCMDYTNNPGTNQHPNAHDYEQLALIYAHLDTTTTVGASLPGGASASTDEEGSDPTSWGKATEKDAKGRPSQYEKDLGKGKKLFTFVIWADSNG